MLQWLQLVVLLLAGGPVLAGPAVRLYPSYNQALHVLVPRGNSTGGTVRWAGPAPDLGRCQASCLAWPDRCWSFVLTGGQCYVVLSPGFNPSYDPAATSGVVAWPCRADDDCSLNGHCLAGRCQCRPAWSGERCERLAVLRPDRSAGYRAVDGGRHTSSWGGAGLRGADGRFHLWAAEMTEHCGIGAWQQNSRVIHATSRTPAGPYTREGVVWPVFSHEPEVVPTGSGQIVMYFTADLRSQHGLCNCCRPGHGPCDGSTGPGDCPELGLGASGSFFSWTTDPNGNWSEPERLFEGYVGGDTNFAPLVLANGSVLAMWRHWGGGNGGSRIFLATAADWRVADSYVQHHTELFPDLGAAGTEDQFLCPGA